MASLPTIVFFHPRAVPESNGRMAAPHLFAARRCDSDATASRAGTSLKKPEATIRALPSGAGQQGGARSLSICFGEGSGESEARHDVGGEAGDGGGVVAGG